MYQKLSQSHQVVNNLNYSKNTKNGSCISWTFGREAHKGVLTNSLQGHVCWPWHACVALITGNAWFCLIACWLSEHIIPFPFATHPSKQAPICSFGTLNHKHQTGHKVYQLNAIPLVIFTSISLPISALCPLRVYSPQQKIPLKKSRHFFLSNTTLKKCKSLSEDYMIQLKYTWKEKSNGKNQNDMFMQIHYTENSLKCSWARSSLCH